MGPVILGMALTAICFTVQGVYLLKTGRFSPRFGRSSSRATPLSTGKRVSFAALYLGSATAVIVLLTKVAEKQHLTIGLAGKYLAGRYSNLLFALVLVSVGIWFLLSPSAALDMTARRTHPDLARDDPIAIVVARLVGAFFCVLGVVTLFSTLS